MDEPPPLQKAQEGISPPQPEVRERVRRHGLEWPLSPCLCFGLSLILIDAVLFSCACIPAIGGNWLRRIVGLAYTLVTVALVVTAYIVARCDPTDPSVGQELSPKELKGLESRPYCFWCNCYKGHRMEHCRTCNRCVRDFDHHCPWLNNCIGGANYNGFAATVALVAVKMFIIVVVSLTLAVEHAINSAVVNARLPGAPPGLIPGTVAVLLVVNTPLLLVDLNLALFHIALRSRQLTTLEYMRACWASELGEAVPGQAPPEIALDTFRPFPCMVDWVICRGKARGKPKSSSKVSPQPASVGAAQVPSTD